MNHVIYFFGSGAAFFFGVGCIFGALALQALRRGKWPLRAGTLLAVVGVILIALSATPLLYWLYGIAGALTIAWIVVERLERLSIAKVRRWLRGCVAAVWV